MATSGEISQMLSAQNGQFMQTNAFANQVGISSPAMALGAYGHGGFMGGMQPVAGGMPGGHGVPGVWSYAPGALGTGYGGGNAFAGGMVAGMGGAATLAGAGIGLAAGFGKLPGLGWIDPFSGFMGAARAAGGFANPIGAFGAGMMGAVPGLAVGALASHAVGSFVHGAQQQAMITSQMGQFQHLNPMSRTGMGFTRDDAKSIGDNIRHLAHVPEMMTSVEELTRLLPALRKAGTFQGVKDIGEFQERFKDSIKTLKAMSKMMGTTMEEASEFMAHSRSVGFLGKQAQLQNALNTQYTSGVTGMSVGQVMGLQQQGASMWRSQGMSGRIGAQAMTNWSQQLGFAQQSGKIGEGVLEDITGMQGPEAVAAAAQRFAGAAFNMTQNTAAGRLTAFGLMKFDENGKAIGVDEDLLARFKKGELSYHDLKARVGGFSSTQKVSATARLRDVGGIVASVAGADGLGRVLQDALSERFGGDTVKGREALNLMLQRNGGLSAMESDVIMGQIGDMGDDGGMAQLGRTRMQRSMEKEKYSPAAMWKRFKTKVHGATFGHLEQAGADIENAFAKAYEEFWDDIFDRNVVQLSKGGADAFKSAMAGNGDGLKKLFAEAHGMKDGDMAKAFAQRSQNQMTTGRFAKLAVGFGVGIGVGVLTANPLLGGAAGAAAMAGFDEWGGTAAVDRAATGGLAPEELARQQAMGRAWNQYKGMTGWSAQKQALGANDVFDFLESRKFKNSAGDAVNYTELSMAERGDILRKGGADYYGSKLSGMFGGGMDGKAMLDAYARGQDYMYDAGDAGTLSISRAEMEERARKDPALARFLEAGNASLAADRAAGINRTGGAEDFAGGATAMLSRGKAGDYSATGRSTKDIMDIKGINELHRETAEGFNDIGIDAGLQDRLGKSSGARDLLSAMAGGNSAVLEAARTGDISKLKQAFPNASKADLDTAYQAYMTANDKGKLQGLVGNLSKATAMGDIKSLQTAANDAYNDLSNHLSRNGGLLSDSQKGIAEKLAAVLQKAGTTKNGDEMAGALDEAKGAISELVSAGSGLKGEALDKFVAGLGPMGAKIKEAIQDGASFKKKGRITAKDIAKRLGKDENDADVQNILHMAKDASHVKADEVDKIEGAIAAVKTAGGLAPAGGTSGAHDKDREIVQALKGIQDASKLQVTLLASIAGKNADDLVRIQDAYANDGAAGADGKTKFHGRNWKGGVD